MNPEAAENFAHHWIAAWNNHDLPAIMEHYSETLLFTSPFIARLGVNEKGVINSKTQLQEYFVTGLQKFPDLKFQLIRCLNGLNSVVLYYTSVNNLLSAEFMEFDDNGKVARVTAHYSE